MHRVTVLATTYHCKPKVHFAFHVVWWHPASERKSYFNVASSLGPLASPGWVNGASDCWSQSISVENRVCIVTDNYALFSVSK